MKYCKYVSYDETTPVEVKQKIIKRCRTDINYFLNVVCGLNIPYYVSRMVEQLANDKN